MVSPRTGSDSHYLPSGLMPENHRIFDGPAPVHVDEIGVANSTSIDGDLDLVRARVIKGEVLDDEGFPGSMTNRRSHSCHPLPVQHGGDVSRT